MDGGNIEIYDKNDQITWSIQDLYYKQVQKWVSDPYAYLTLSDDGNTLSVIGSDKNHNFGNNGLIWSHANHKTSRNQ